MSSGPLTTFRDVGALVPGTKGRESAADKRLRKARAPIEAWDRYRVLRHAFDEAQKLEDLADHKARFALILMGGLNAFLLVLEFRIDILGLLSASLRPWVIGYLAVYGLVAFHFFLQAIEALRPRSIDSGEGLPADIEDRPAGLRDYRKIVEQNLPSFVRNWREVRVGQLNTEMVVQLHEQAQVNRAKMRALRQVYAGLRVMTLLMAGLVLVAVFGARSATRTGAQVAPHGGASLAERPAIPFLAAGLPWAPPAP